MDNEKFRSGETGSGKDSGEITAEDLIRRLKSNIKKDPNYVEGDLADPGDVSSPETAAEDTENDPSNLRRFRIKSAIDEFGGGEEDTPVAETETAPAFEEEEAPALEETALEETAAEETAVEEDAPSETFAAPEEKAGIGETVAENVRKHVSEKELNKFRMFATMSETEASEELTPEPEAKTEETETQSPNRPLKVRESNAEISVENMNSSTNVYKPKTPKGKRSSFEEELPATEAEQLSFGAPVEEEAEKAPAPEVSEEELQKSIEEAEAFIYERERIDNPGDVIAESEAKSEEENSEEGKEGYDQTDIWLASAFGDEDELREQIGEEAAQEVEEQLESDAGDYLDAETKESEYAFIDEEFTPESNTKLIFDKYKKLNKNFMIKLGVLAVMMLFTFFYENLGIFGGGLPTAMNRGAYPVVYTLLSLQLVVLMCAVAYKQLYNGLMSLVRRKPIPESLTAVAAAASVLVHVVFIFVPLIKSNYSLYVFPLNMCIFLTVLYDYFNLRREVYSFNVISSKKLKYTVNRIDDSEAVLENEAFSEYLSGDDVSMFRIGKTSFVNGFRERINAYPKQNSYLRFFIIGALAFGVIFTVIASATSGFAEGLSLGALVFALTLPASLMFSYSYPFYRAVKKAFADDSTIVGDGSLTEYDGANTISFDDKDVFPSYSVKVKSIKVYGDSRIDKILYDVASIFKVLGGPLSDVFEMATFELGHSEDVEIITIDDDGIEAVVDGQHICVGKAEFMRSRSFEPIYDSSDEMQESTGDSSIMYLATGDEINAKMYIRYLIDPDFEFTLNELYRAGLCVGIKTFDPNINDRLLGQKIEVARYPVKVLRCHSLDDMNVTTEEADSGIVSRSSSRSLLGAFMLCSKVLYTRKLSLIVKVLSVVIGLLLTTFLLLFGGITSIPSVYVALYHLVFTLLIFAFSRAYI